MLESIIIILILWNIGQGAFFLWQLQTLVNKLMSRDFSEYFKSYQPPVIRRNSLQEVDYHEDIHAPPNDLGF